MLKRKTWLLISTLILIVNTNLANALNSLYEGQQLNVNDYIESNNGQYKFYLQSDSNLVLYNNSGDALWASNTVGKNGTRLKLQGDGNLVLLTNSESVVWSSKTAGTAVTQLKLNNSGMLALYDDSQIVWAVNEFDEPDTSTIIETRINRGSDDVEERENGGMYVDSSDIELVTDKDRLQTVGLRFTNLDIPQGAEIINAYVQFTVDETNSVSTSLNIRAEDIDSAPSFNSDSFNLTVRNQTTASSYWQPNAWNTVGAEGIKQRTPDLSSVIQEVVDRSGWIAGNNIALIITGSGERTAESFEGKSSSAALLHIEYIQEDDDDEPGNDGISHIGSTADYDKNGNVNIAVDANTRKDDLLLLFLSRTDDLLPIRQNGWTAGASCFKTNNGQSECHEIKDCSNRDGDYCLRFNDGNGRDLATVVFYKTVGATDPQSYSFNLRGSKPGWAILTTLRGASNNDPIRDVATESNDRNSDSLFPSVNGSKGDMLLLSQAFDDTTNRDDFRAPAGMDMFRWIAGSDEAGYVYGELLSESGQTGSRKTQGPGGPKAKDALISLTIK